jgi:cytoskeleton protein RodZ
MIEKNTTSSVEISTPSMGPGDKLQAARISIGLTIEDVANKMHLSESILSSLEENDFDDITAPIFVKGYLRSYARIVNVDENEIIQQYTSFYTDGDPPIHSTSNTSPEINSGDTRVKWITRLVIVGLVALLSIWWWNRYQEPAQPMSLDSGGQTPQIADAPQDSADNFFQESSSEELSQQAQDSLEALPEQPVDNSSALQEPATEGLAVQMPDMEPVESEPEETAPETAIEGDNTESGEIQQDDNVATTPAPESIVDAEALVLTVSADTWTDVRDADGNKLVYDLLQAGEEIVVTGKTPMRAFFGNGYGVSIKYKGKDIDLSASIRDDNTARVMIGQ